MNHVYRSVWNEATRTFVAAAETVKGRGKRSRSRKEAAEAALEVSSQADLAGIVSPGVRPMALEQRFMFDGAAVAEALQALEPAMDPAVYEADDAGGQAEADVAETVASWQAVQSAAERDAGDAQGSYGLVRAVPGASELLFIDSAVADRQLLIDAARDGIEVVVLDPAQDPWAQMREAVARHQGLTAVHIVSHGLDGQLVLGGVAYGLAGLETEAERLQVWQAHLADDADVLIYGCDVAAGAAGGDFIQALARLTQADVAASTDATGAESLGGDWVLEAATGGIETAGFLGADAQERFEALLDGNTAPVLNPSVDLEIEVGASKGAPTNGSLAGATLVSSLTGGISDLESPNPGIAIVKYDNSKINAFYSVDDGTTWVAVPSNASESGALLLESTDYLYLAPKSAFKADDLPLEIRGWDGTQGTAGSQFNITVSGGATAFSADKDVVKAAYSVGTNVTPSLTATGADPTFTEGAGAGAGGQGTAVTLFTNVTVSVGEASNLQTITSLRFTVSGLADGADEKILVDGGSIALVATNTGALASSVNGLSYTVTVAGTTATVTLSKTDGVTASELQAIVAGMTYQNTDVDQPTAGVRTVTLTQIVDNGTDNNTTALTTASAVTVVALNDAPVLDANFDARLPPVAEGTLNPAGIAVGTLIRTGQITDPDTDEAPRAIYITGVVNAGGMWQYQLDGDTEWQTIDFSTQPGKALLLRPADTLRYVPPLSAGLTAPTVTFGAWDTTNADATIKAGAYVTVGAGGGSSAYSSQTDTLGIGVEDVNGQPTIPNFGDRPITVDQPFSILLDGAIDPDDDRLTYTVSVVRVVDNVEVVQSLPSGFQFNPTTLRLSGAFNQVCGTTLDPITIRVTVTDEGGLSASDDFILTPEPNPNAVSVKFPQVYELVNLQKQGQDVPYEEETSSHKTAPASLVGSHFTFTQTFAGPASLFNGNNVPGVLSYINADGEVVSITGQATRPIKSPGNTVEGFYFWVDADPSSGTDTLDNEGYLFVINPSYFAGNGTFGSSSDAVDTALNKLLQSPVFSISSAVANEAQGYIDFTVTRCGVGGGSVSYQTLFGAADTASAADITGKSGSLSWSATDASAKTLRVFVNDDNLHEASETFTVRLFDASTGTRIAADTATGTILDDDVTSFSAADAGAVEGNAITFTVTRTGDSQVTQTVNYATRLIQTGPDRAVASDFIAAAGTLTFAAGETRKTVTVQTLQDDVLEGDETFELVLSNASAGSEISVTGGVAVGTIENDDAALPVPVYSVADAVVTEGGKLAFRITRSESTDADQVVAYATSPGSAGAPGDYTTLTGTVTFSKGELSRIVEVLTTGDSVYEATETMSFTISTAPAQTGYEISATEHVATGTILDNDAAPVFGVLPASASEGTASNGQISFTVVMTNDSALAHSVAYATQIGSTDSASVDDFIASAGVLSFDPADGGDFTWNDELDRYEATVTVQASADGEFERDETFALRLDNATGGANIDPAAATAMGTILNDDDAGVVVVGGAFNENSPRAMFTVYGTPGLDITLTLADAAAPGGRATTGLAGATMYYSTDAGATWSEYTGTAFENSIGEVLVAVDITAEKDDEFEGLEQLRLTATVVGQPVTGFGYSTIRDDGLGLITAPITQETLDERGEDLGGTRDNDLPGFSINSVSYNEAAGTMVFTVSINAGVSGEVSVDYATRDGVALASSDGVTRDYETTSGTLTFSSTAVDGRYGDFVFNADTGRYEATVSVSINNDAVYEGSEAMFVDLSNVVSDGAYTETVSIGSPAGRPLTSGNSQTATLTVSQALANALTTSTGGTITLVTDFQESPFPKSGVPIPADDPSFLMDPAPVESEVTATIKIGSKTFIVVDAKDDSTAWTYNPTTGLLEAPVSLDNIRELILPPGKTVTDYANNLPGSGNGSVGTLTLADYLESNPAAANNVWTFSYDDNNGGPLQARYVDFEIALTGGSPVGIAVPMGTGTIRDDGFGLGGNNDDRSITVSGLDDVSEGSDAIFTVTLQAPRAAVTEITLSWANGQGGNDAAESSDYVVSYSNDGSDGTKAAVYYYAGQEQVFLAVVDGKIQLPAGVTTFYVRSPSTQDVEFEGKEDFQLTAAVTGGKSGADTSTIVDDGSGKIYDPKGQNPVGPGDDDRPQLTVTGLDDVSEGSYAVFTVDTGRRFADSTPTAERTIRLALTDVTTKGNQDYEPAYTAFYEAVAGDPQSRTALPVEDGLVVLPGGVRTFYVAVETVTDGVLEGAEDLRLTAAFEAAKLKYADRTDGALRSGSSASDTGTIVDDGTGKVYDAQGKPTAAAPDDDRPISVDSFSVNEGSPYAVFRVVADPLSTIQLTLSNGIVNLGPDGVGALGDGVDYGTRDAAQDATDLDLQIWSGQTWVPYEGGPITVPAGTSDKSPLFVRTAIVNDTPYERAEDFRLTATYVRQAGESFVATSGSFTGKATIRDDGQGVIFLFDGVNQAGAPAGTTDRNLDDDLRLNVSSFSVNEGSSHAVYSVQAVGGQFIELALQNGSALLDEGGSQAADGSEDFGPGLQYWNGSAWVNYTGRFTIPGSGPLTLLVRTALVNDTVYEGAETFRLTASYFTAPTGGEEIRSATGQATIRDDGNGVRFVFNADGSLQGTSSENLNDDRGLFVSSPVVNEASDWVVFTVKGNAGSTLDLALRPTGTGPGHANIGVDTGLFPGGVQLQVYDGTTWVDYSPSAGASFPAGSSLMLVRAKLVNDGSFEGRETLALAATVRGSGATALGKATIVDDGTGSIFRANGTEDLTAARDDDRSLRVNSVRVNEGSSYAVFTLNVTPNDRVTVMLEDVGSASNPGGSTADVDDALEYWNESTNSWTPVGAGFEAPSGGTVYVRVNITPEQEREYEGAETFRLAVSAASLPGQVAYGTATIIDDGSGVRFTGEIRPEGPVWNTQDLDDDLDRDGIAPTAEQQLATLVASQGLGAAKAGDLNGDGQPDAEQNALATLAWRDVASFEAGNAGTLTDVRPIISISALDGSGDTTVSRTLQLENIRVVAFDEQTEFGRNPPPVVIDARTGTRTVTLADGRTTVTTPWDPLRFELGTQTDGATFTDLFQRPGTQVRMYIDIRAAGLDASTFNRYIKFVSRDAITAAGAAGLVDLDGRAITREGWYDFTQRKPDGDGARFVLENGKIIGIELIITDNAFGDSDRRANRILDPGVPVYVQLVPPALLDRGLDDLRTSLPFDHQDLAWDGGQPLRFDSALHPLIARDTVAPTYLTEPVDVRQLPTLDWMSFFDIYTNSAGWRVAVIEGGGDGLSVFRGMADQFVDAGGTGRLPVPWDTFVHGKAEATVQLTATLADGSPLPAWLALDKQTGAFTYQVPAAWRGELVIRLTARDAAGREASTMFRLSVGERAIPRASDDGRQPGGRMGLHEQLRDAARQRLAQPVSPTVATPG